MWEAMRIIDEGDHGFCRANANPSDASQLSDGRRVLRLMIQLLLDTSHLAQECLDLSEQEIPPQLLRRCRQGQLTEPCQAQPRSTDRVASRAQRWRCTRVREPHSWPVSAWQSPGCGS
jgi:hypothetical protein